MKRVSTLSLVLWLVAAAAQAHTIHLPDTAGDVDAVVVNPGETFTVEGERRVSTLVVHPGGTLVCRPKSVITILDRAPKPTTNIDTNQLNVGVVCGGNWQGDGFEVRSENPNGHRGHVLITGHGEVDLRNCKFTDLGRTTNAPLDELKNKIGRYPLHFHHFWGLFTLEDFEINRGPKWGLVIHGSHFGNVRRGVIRDCLGSGLVLEDFTAGNVVEDIEISGSTGIQPFITPVARNAALTDFGYDGAGLWARGVGNNTIRNITVRNCRYGALVVPSSIGDRIVRLPSRQGVNPDGPEGYAFNTLNIAGHRPIEGLTTENCEIGFEFWNFFNTGTVPVTLKNSKLHATQRGISTFFIHVFDLQDTTVDAPLGFVHQAGKDNVPDMYSHFLRIARCQFKGETGIAIRPRNGAHIADTAFDCATSIKLYRRIDDACDITLQRCTHTGRRLWVEPLNWASFTGPPEPSDALSPLRILVDDRRLWDPVQLPSYVCPTTQRFLSGSPEPGRTNAELQANYGVSTLGYMAPADAAWDERYGLWASPSSEAELPPTPQLVRNATRGRVDGGPDMLITCETNQRARPTLVNLRTQGVEAAKVVPVFSSYGSKHQIIVEEQPQQAMVVGYMTTPEGLISRLLFGNVEASKIVLPPNNTEEIAKLKAERDGLLSKRMLQLDVLEAIDARIEQIDAKLKELEP